MRCATRRRHAEARLLMLQNPHRQRCGTLRKGQRARAGPGAACFPMTPPPNGGNCTNRGATRRRHAEGRLLMLQNPHRQRCDALRKGQRARAGPGAACFPMTPPPNGGNCTNRATTRRRHAGRMLLMVQYPHHYPWRHAPSLVQGSPAGTDKRQKGVTDEALLHRRRYSRTVRPLGLASPTGPAAQARVGRVPINAGKASPTEPGQGHGRTVPRRRLWPMRRNTRSG